MDVFEDVDDKLFVFETLFTEVLGDHAPLKQFHVRDNQVPYMTEEWQKVICYRNRLWRKFTKDRTDSNYQLYKAQRNKCTSLKRKAIKGFFSKKVTQSENPREFWEAYRPFLHSKNSKQANDIILQENDVVFTDKKQVAELFNEHFVHIADGVGEITDHHYGEGFCDDPSIKVIQANIGTKGEEDCLSFQLTNATQIEDL